MFQGEDVDFLEEMYKIKEIGKIGEGSFGKVYKAIDLTDNTECAVKVVSKTLFKDAQVESDIYQQLNHPHIVKCKRVHQHSYEDNRKQELIFFNYGINERWNLSLENEGRAY
ncbi:unnamed protein product [Paramecium sonneborni]|uniref:non-specific serine/threonine protein kinase n=1 Tax=Paramecium sonneborni TaxID=65129 RepID=A0A8S1R9Y5_9CILI|nr:unnamed protein product [Paramecium sonneborni]